jgi:DNA-binding transcriptional regulator YiaG
MDAVARLENAAHLSLKSLAYHNVKVTEMSETIDDALRALIEDQLRKSAAADSPSPPETIAAQIQRLRKESKWSVEKLAETVSLNLRTVTRHLSGSTIPHLGNISAYERVFAKRLKREVVISKMP